MITTLLKLQRCKHDDVSPYNDIQCRSGLLKLLTTMVLLPSLATQAFLSQSMYIFSRGQMDSSPKVRCRSKYCSFYFIFVVTVLKKCYCLI